MIACERQTSRVRTAAKATLHLFPDLDELMRIWCDSWWTEEEEPEGAGEEHRVTINHRRQTQAGTIWEIRNDRLIRRPSSAHGSVVGWGHGEMLLRLLWVFNVVVKRCSLITLKPLIRGWRFTGLYFTSSLAWCLLSHENVFESDNTK